MKYAELILKATHGQPLETSLYELIMNVDAMDKTVPTLSELNDALEGLANSGNLVQLSETQYRISPSPESPASTIAPISKEAFEKLIQNQQDAFYSFMASRGVSKENADSAIKTMVDMGLKGKKFD